MQMFNYEEYEYLAPAVLAVILTTISALLLTRPKQANNEPPLAVGLPFIGHGIKFISNFPGLVDEMRRKHGPIFTVINFGKRMHFITDYKSIRKIWAQPAFDFKEFAFKAEANFSGIMTEQDIKASGVGSADLAKFAHRMQGQDDLNALARRFSEALEETVSNTPFLHCTEWTRMDLREFCGIIVFYAAGRSLFGSKWLEGVDAREAARQYAIFENDAPGIVGGLPKLFVRKGSIARDYIVRKVILPIVRDGCKDGHPYVSTYMSTLKRAHAGDEFADLKVASRISGLLFGIMTNTMNLMFWSLARIQLADESVKTRLEEEIRTATEQYPSSYLECKRNMPLMNSVIIETFRLHADPNSFRIVEKDCVVSGLAGGKDLAFRKGDTVFLLSTYEQLKDIEGNRDAFDGGRWLKHTSNHTTNKSLLSVPSDQVLAPFGGGKHLCPGRFFALLEMHLVVAFCFKHYEFKVESALPDKIVELAAPINQPKSAMIVSLRYKGEHKK